MLFVSSEVGSKHLVTPLRRAGLEVPDPVPLDYADVEFVGRGIGGCAVSIGVEIKRLSELTGDWDRFVGEQVPKMSEHYAYRYLLFQGRWKQNASGDLVQWSRRGYRRLRGQSSAASLRKKLYGLPLRAGVLTYPTQDTTDTVRHLVHLYRLWTDEDFEKHTSHLVVYQPHGILVQSDFVRAVCAWPGVGLKRAKAAERVFGTVRRAALASLSEWAGVETIDEDGHARKTGQKTAERIIAFLEGA